MYFLSLKFRTPKTIIFKCPSNDGSRLELHFALTIEIPECHNSKYNIKRYTVRLIVAWQIHECVRMYAYMCVHVHVSMKVCIYVEHSPVCCMR
jgi:hypothetical protein